MSGIRRGDALRLHGLQLKVHERTERAEGRWEADSGRQQQQLSRRPTWSKNVSHRDTYYNSALPLAKTQQTQYNSWADMVKGNRDVHRNVEIDQATTNITIANKAPITQQETP